MSHIRRKRKANGKTGGNLIFGVLVILIIYLLVTGVAGRWVSQYVITPVFNSFSSPSSTATNGNNDKKVSEDIKLAPQVLYFIQLGAYDQEKNAEDQAVSVRNRGAAGYVLKSDNQYRVLAWGYKTKQDALQVQRQLLETDNTSSEIYTAAVSVVTLKVSGKQSDVNAIKDAVNKYADYLDRLSNMSIGIEKGELGKEAIIAELNKINDEMKLNQSILNAINKNSKNTSVKALSDLYAGNIKKITDLIAADKTLNGLASEVKFMYIDMYYGYCDMIKGLK